jgi:hypothetical protein
VTFAEFAKSFRSFLGVATGISTVGPLALWARELQPPWWPPAIAPVASLFCVAAVILAFVVTQLADSSGQRTSRWIGLLGSAFLIIGLCACVSYLYGYGSLVVRTLKVVDKQEETLHFVIGTEMRSGIEASDKSAEDLLRQNLYRPERIWTAHSLKWARLFLAGTFILTFFFFTLGAAILVPISTRKHA